MMLPLWASALSATLLVQSISYFAFGAVPLLGPILTAQAALPPEGIGYIAALITMGNCWYLACGGPMLTQFGPTRSLQIGLVLIAFGLLVLSQPVGAVALVGAVAIGFGLGPNTSAEARCCCARHPGSTARSSSPSSKPAFRWAARWRALWWRRSSQR